MTEEGTAQGTRPPGSHICNPLGAPVQGEKWQMEASPLEQTEGKVLGTIPREEGEGTEGSPWTGRGGEERQCCHICPKLSGSPLLVAPEVTPRSRAGSSISSNAPENGPVCPPVLSPAPPTMAPLPVPSSLCLITGPLPWNSLSIVSQRHLLNPVGLATPPPGDPGPAPPPCKDPAAQHRPCTTGLGAPPSRSLTGGSTPGHASLIPGAPSRSH